MISCNKSIECFLRIRSLFATISIWLEHKVIDLQRHNKCFFAFAISVRSSESNECKLVRKCNFLSRDRYLSLQHKDISWCSLSMSSLELVFSFKWNIDHQDKPREMGISYNRSCNASGVEGGCNEYEMHSNAIVLWSVAHKVSPLHKNTHTAIYAHNTQKLHHAILLIFSPPLIRTDDEESENLINLVQWRSHKREAWYRYHEGALNERVDILMLRLPFSHSNIYSILGEGEGGGWGGIRK